MVFYYTQCYDWWLTLVDMVFYYTQCYESCLLWWTWSFITLSVMTRNLLWWTWSFITLSAMTGDLLWWIWSFITLSVMNRAYSGGHGLLLHSVLWLVTYSGGQGLLLQSRLCTSGFTTLSQFSSVTVAWLSVFTHIITVSIVPNKQQMLSLCTHIWVHGFLIICDNMQQE